MPGLTVDLDTVQTNLVRVDCSASGHTAYDISVEMSQEDVAIHAFEPFAFKFAVHYQICDEDVARALSALGRVMERIGTMEVVHS